MPRMLSAARGGAALCLLSGLLGCGGSSGPSFGISPTNLTFSAADPNAPLPPSQTVTLTLNGTVSGTLYIKIVVTGDAVSSISDVTAISTTQGRATVNPADPGLLGGGTHSSVISVSACTTDPNCTGPLLAGSPQTVNVTYQIGTLPTPDAVAPRVGTANVAGEVVIRGMGFTGTTTVSFGGTPATALSVVSST
ncbi:MAG TPA: hypothetical protein VE964_17110, partial [Myxococcales bacterium]|nr:hypothetical protein [Myxococcales bacterium]